MGGARQAVGENVRALKDFGLSVTTEAATSSDTRATTTFMSAALTIEAIRITTASWSPSSQNPAIHVGSIGVAWATGQSAMSATSSGPAVQRRQLIGSWYHTAQALATESPTARPDGVTLLATAERSISLFRDLATKHGLDGWRHVGAMLRGGASHQARRPGARLSTPRRATSLARLWHGQGRTRQARALLAPVY